MLIIVVTFYVVKRLRQDLARFKYIASVLEVHKREVENIESKFDMERLETLLFEKIMYEVNIMIQENSSALESDMIAIKENVELNIKEYMEKQDKNIEVFKDTFDYKLTGLENSLKGITISPRDSGGEGKRVGELYDRGLSKDDIAKELKISKSEIDFALKLSKLR